MNGKWRIVRIPDYEADFPDMVEPAYSLFDGNSGGGDDKANFTARPWKTSSTAC